MKKLQKLKVIIIAAGIILSAVFYVLSGAATDAFGGSKDSLIIGGSAAEEDMADDNAASAGKSEMNDKKGRGLLGFITGTAQNADSNPDAELDAAEESSTKLTDNKTATDTTQDEETENMLSEAFAERLSEEIYIDKNGRGYLSDALKAEIRTSIREAVRKELVALCEEGYLEQAVNEAASYAAAEAERRRDMVNINTADISELMTLPGIGEKKAADIIAYRDANGAFNNIEEIMQISGIKQSSYDKFKDKIYV